MVWCVKIDGLKNLAPQRMRFPTIKQVFLRKGRRWQAARPSECQGNHMNVHPSQENWLGAANDF